jgi:hypothetical protein
MLNLSSSPQTEKQCATKSVPDCRIVPRDVPDKQCATRTVPDCATAVKEVPEEQCTIVSDQKCTEEQQCTTKLEIVVDTTHVEECQDVVTQTCTETKVTVHNHQAVVGHESHGTVEVAAPVALAAGHHEGAAIPPQAGLGHALFSGHYGRGRREAEASPEADPESAADAEADPYYSYYGRGNLPAPQHVVPAAAPVCNDVTQRQCRKVPVQSQRQVAVPHCVQVPRCVDVPRKACTTVARQVSEVVCHPKPVTECAAIVRQVPEKVCVDRPVTECLPITRSVPVQVPVKRCQPVAREVCHPVAEKVAREVCEEHGAYGAHH